LLTQYHSVSVDTSRSDGGRRTPHTAWTGWADDRNDEAAVQCRNYQYKAATHTGELVGN